jgi:hypothetical protein
MRSGELKAIEGSLEPSTQSWKTARSDRAAPGVLPFHDAFSVRRLSSFNVAVRGRPTVTSLECALADVYQDKGVLSDAFSAVAGGGLNKALYTEALRKIVFSVPLFEPPRPWVKAAKHRTVGQVHTLKYNIEVIGTQQEYLSVVSQFGFRRTSLKRHFFVSPCAAERPSRTRASIR